MERSVELVVLTEVPGMGLVAVVRERGYYSIERMKPALWPGGCQVTVHGKVEAGESLNDALFREMREELGKEFADAVFVVDTLRRDAGKAPEETVREVNRLETTEKSVVTFAVKADIYMLATTMRLSVESGALRFVRREEISEIADLRSFDITTGVPVRNVIAMFPDEREAVQKAFALFT